MRIDATVIHNYAVAWDIYSWIMQENEVKLFA
jgi:hypothetical protein